MRNLVRQAGVSAILLTIASSGAAEQKPFSPRAFEEMQARRAITESGKLLHNDVPLAAMFEQARVLGLRSDGIYWRNDIGTVDQAEIVRLGKRRNTYTNYLRFCEDGSVVGAVSSGLPKDVQVWLTCQPLNPKHSHGVVRVEGNVVRFSQHMVTGVIDYWGGFGRQIDSIPRSLELNVRSNIEIAETYGRVLQEEYQFHPW